MSDVTAALITAKETVTFRRFSQAPPRSGCVTVDISLCGICGTEINSFRSGHLHSPAVCGHEWVGTVAAAGAGVDGLQEGDRVVLAVPPACGRCPECHRGLGEYCRMASLVARGRDPLAPLHGGFAGTITVQATRVMHAHPALTDEVAAQVEPATVAFHGVRRSGITAGDTVVGTGRRPDRAVGAAVRPGRRRRGCAGGRAIADAPAACHRAWCDQCRGTGRGGRMRPGPHARHRRGRGDRVRRRPAPAADRGGPGSLRWRGPAPQLSLRGRPPSTPPGGWRSRSRSSPRMRSPTTTSAAA